MKHQSSVFLIPVDIAYGSLSLFTTVIHNIFLLYHVDMFVSVYKIDKTSFWVGEMIFLVWNSLNDPVFGWISDQKYLTRRRSNNASSSAVVLQRLNSLMWTGPLFAFSFMSFWIPWLYPGIQFVICLCLYDGFLTMIDLHHDSLLADLEISADARTKLNSRSSLFSILGSSSVFLSYIVWNKDDLFQFQIFCAILTFISLFGFYTMTRLLKGMFHNNAYGRTGNQENARICSGIDESDKHKLKSFIKDLSTQSNFRWFALLNLIQVFHCHFNSNFFPLFLEHLLGQAISPGFGPFLIGVSFVAPHINNLYFLSLCRKYGVYAVIRMLFIVKLSLSLIMFMAGPSHIWLLCIFIASNRVFTEGTCKLLNLVISDLVDEDFVLHNRTHAVSALIFGTTALLSKPGQTIAPLIGTWLLTQQTGHDIFQTGNELGSIKPVRDMLTPSSLSEYRQGCFNLLVYVPLVCAVCQLAVWTQFNLHGPRLKWIKSMREGASHLFV